MDDGAIYEFVYPAKDAVPAGLAFVATADVVSFLRGNDAARRQKPGDRDPAHHRHGDFPIRPDAEGLHLSGVQRRRGRQAGLRRGDAAHRRLAQDLHQLSLRPARPLFAPARGPRLPRRPVPLHLCRDHRSGLRRKRQHPQRLHGDGHLSQGDPDRQLDRVLAGTRRSGLDRAVWRALDHAGRCAAVLHRRRAALQWLGRRFQENRRLRLSVQSGQRRTDDAGAGRRHGRMGSAATRHRRQASIRASRRTSSSIRPNWSCRPSTGRNRIPCRTRWH